MDNGSRYQKMLLLHTKLLECAEVENCVQAFKSAICHASGLKVHGLLGQNPKS